MVTRGDNVDLAAASGVSLKKSLKYGKIHLFDANGTTMAKGTGAEGPKETDDVVASSPLFFSFVCERSLSLSLSRCDFMQSTAFTVR